MFKENIVGGPSIIFNRYHETDKTFIRNNPNKPCQKIIGYDPNALYLWAIGQNFPAGYPLIRRQEKYFVREFPQFSGGCRDWIDWLIHERNIDIQPAFHGGEKKIGPGPIKSTVSVKLLTPFSNFMVTTGIVIQTSSQTKAQFTLLSKIKTITP